MKKREKLKKEFNNHKFIINTIFIIFSFVLILIATTSSAYAWFIGYVGVESESSDIVFSSNTSYFASGDGTEDDPYMIETARNLYNLAWLQDLGYFDSDDDSDTSTSAVDSFYFELGCDIDMSDLSKDSVQSPIPPIGIDDHPFISNFDGNGYTISNLYISTFFDSDTDIMPSTTVLTNHSETISSGTIQTSYVGMFGYVGDLDGDELDTSVSDFYISEADVETDESALIGFICGYAANDLDSIGVYYSNLDIGTSVTAIDGYDYLSLYTIVGDYLDSTSGSITWTDAPSDGSIGYGASTDLETLGEKMTSILGNNNSIEKNQYLPFSGDGTKVYDSDGDIVGEEADDDNMGYFTGNGIKNYSIDLSDIADGFYEPTSTFGSITSYSVSSSNTVYSGTFGKDYDDSSDITMIRLQSALSITSDLVSIDDADIAGTTEDIVIPRRCVWVDPTSSGTMRFVIVAKSKTSNQFSLYKFKRETTGDLTSDMTDLSIVLNSTDYDGLAYGSDVDTIDGASDSTTLKKQMVAYYFEYDVTDDDISDGYEFALANENDGSGAYFWYLDMGASGGSSTSIGTIDNVDFVYADSSTTSGFNEVSEDTLSGVAFELSGTSTTEVTLYIYRNETSVLYYFDGSGITVEPIGTGTYSKASSLSDLTS